MKTSSSGTPPKRPSTPREYYEKHTEGWKHIPWEQLNKDAQRFWTERYEQSKNA